MEQPRIPLSPACILHTLPSLIWLSYKTQLRNIYYLSTSLFLFWTQSTASAQRRESRKWKLPMLNFHENFEFKGTRSNWSFFVQTPQKPDAIMANNHKRRNTNINSSQKATATCSRLVCTEPLRMRTVGSQRTWPGTHHPSLPPRCALTTLKLHRRDTKLWRIKAVKETSDKM